MKVTVGCRECGRGEVVNGQKGVDKFRKAHLHGNPEAGKTGKNIGIGAVDAYNNLPHGRSPEGTRKRHQGPKVTHWTPSPNANEMHQPFLVPGGSKEVNARIRAYPLAAAAALEATAKEEQEAKSERFLIGAGIDGMTFEETQDALVRTHSEMGHYNESGELSQDSGRYAFEAGWWEQSAKRFARNAKALRELLNEANARITELNGAKQ